ncbi:MAG TPA: YfhO family protein [Thermoanaerobaculia bacterium]
MLATPLLLFGVIALAVALWNRLFTAVPWRVVAIFCALLAAYQAETLFTSRVDLPGRICNSVYPWKALGGAPIRANTGIVVTELVPWTDAARQELLAGDLPLWNRGLGAGSPLLASQQTAIFHPFTLLGLALPIGKAWTLSVGLRLFSCLFFLFVFLREWRLPTLAAIFGAVAYTFCTFHVVWLLFPLGLATMALPVGLAAATELVRRPRSRSFLLLVLALSLAILGGHPESALFVGVTVGAYALYLTLTEHFPAAVRLARLARAAAAALAAVLLTAPVWYPTLAVLPLTDRYQAFRGLAAHPPPRRVTGQWLLPLLAPNILGNVQTGTYQRPETPDRSIPSDYGEVATGYSGAAALALALAGFGMARRRPAGFFLAALAAAVLTVAEAPVWYPLICRLPLLGIALHQRLRFLYALGVAVGAATALGKLLEHPANWRPVRWGLCAAGLLVGAVHALGWHDLAERGASHFALVQLALSLGVLLVLAGMAAARVPRPAFVAAAIALTLLELGAVTWRYNPAAFPGEVLPPTGAVRALAQGAAPHRMVAVGASFMPDTPGAFGLEDVKTTDPIHAPRYAQLLQALLEVRPGDNGERVRAWESPFLDFLNVTAIYSPPETPQANPDWRLVYGGKDGLVFANPHALPRYFLATRWRAAPSFELARRQMEQIADFRQMTVVNRVPWWVGGAPPGTRQEGQGGGGAVRLLSYTGSRTCLDVASRGWNLLVTSDASWPGWRITWNGARLPPVLVNGVFLGVFLPPGKGVLELRYRPREFDLGLALAGGALLALAAGLAVSRLYRRRRAAAGCPAAFAK